MEKEAAYAASTVPSRPNRPDARVIGDHIESPRNLAHKICAEARPCASLKLDRTASGSLSFGALRSSFQAWRFPGWPRGHAGPALTAKPGRRRDLGTRRGSEPVRLRCERVQKPAVSEAVQEFFCGWPLLPNPTVRAIASSVECELFPYFTPRNRSLTFDLAERLAGGRQVLAILATTPNWPYCTFGPVVHQCFNDAPLMRSCRVARGRRCVRRRARPPR